MRKFSTIQGRKLKSTGPATLLGLLVATTPALANNGWPGHGANFHPGNLPLPTTGGLKATASGVGATIEIKGNATGTALAIDTISATAGSITTDAGTDISAGKTVTFSAPKGSLTVNGTIDQKAAGSIISSETVTMTAPGKIHTAGTVNSVKTLTLTSAKGEIDTDGGSTLSSTAANVIFSALNKIEH